MYVDACLKYMLNVDNAFFDKILNVTSKDDSLTKNV
jgi:hypothetical protein